MAAYLLAYLGYQEFKSSENPDDSPEKVPEQSSNQCEIILDSLRKVNKNLLLIVFILLTVILLLIIVRRMIKIRKNRNLKQNSDYTSNSHV